LEKIGKKFINIIYISVKNNSENVPSSGKYPYWGLDVG